MGRKPSGYRHRMPSAAGLVLDSFEIVENRDRLIS